MTETEPEVAFRKKLLMQRNGESVYLVDAEAVRNHSLGDEEFGDYATHSWFPRLVPPHEVWIADTVHPEERHILAATGIREDHLRQSGKSFDEAYKLSLQFDKQLRDTEMGRRRRRPAKPPPDLYVRDLVTIPDQGLTVWLVDAEKVRNIYMTAWIEAGQPEVYHYQPKGEIWADANLHPSEIPPIIVHEFTEFCLMKYRKMKYNLAHPIASKVEFMTRGRITLDEISKLTAAGVLSVADRYRKAS